MMYDGLNWATTYLNLNIATIPFPIPSHSAWYDSTFLLTVS